MSGSRERAADFDLSVVLNTLRRHKWIILASLVLGNVIVAAGLLLYGQHYTATASILIEHRENPVLDSKPIARALPEWMPGDNSVMSTQVELLKSPAIAASVVKELDLTGDPELRPTMAKLVADFRNLIRQWLPAEWVAGGQFLAPESGRLDDTTALRGFQRRLSVEQEGTSHVILVSFTSSDAAKAAQVANAVVRAYLSEALKAKSEAANRAFDWAKKNVEEIGVELTKAEDDVAEYMAKTGLVAANASDRADGGLAAQQLANLQRDLATARATVAADKAKVDQLRELQARGGHYASLPEVAGSQFILELQKQDIELLRQQARLSSSYGERSPVLGQITAQRAGIAAGMKREIDRIVRNFENELAIAQGRVDALQATVISVSKQYAEAERKSVQLRELNRIASARRKLYESLLTRLNEIDEQRALLEPDARGLSSAKVPTLPSSPRTGLVGAAGFVGSLVLGISLAGLREQSDRRIRTPEQLAREVGVTALALVPTIGKQSLGERLLRYLNAEPLSIYAEATRSVLTSVQLTRPGDGAARVIVVTSALPGEGKTTMAMSLAALAARRGHRTVIVDLDTHRPSLLAQLGRPIVAGLTEFMSGLATLNEIIHVHPREPRLHIVAAQRSKTLPDLISTKLQALIDELRLRYEWIVLDLPPTIAVSDVQTVAPLADAALFVVQWGKTSLSAVTRGLQVLGTTGVKVTGAVLTKVDLSDQALYGADAEYYRKCQEYFRS